MTHDIHRVEVPADDVAIVDATVTYRFKNGVDLALPCITTFRFRGDEVHSVHIDLDATAVAAARGT